MGRGHARADRHTSTLILATKKRAFSDRCHDERGRASSSLRDGTVLSALREPTCKRAAVRAVRASD